MQYSIRCLGCKRCDGRSACVLWVFSANHAVRAPLFACSTCTLRKAAVFSLSSRLLLQALVTVPSSGGVVEELLATAAVSTQTGTPGKTGAIALAADVLSLVASGDISLSKVIFKLSGSRRQYCCWGEIY